jgi:hypothetical protein
MRKNVAKSKSVVRRVYGVLIACVVVVVVVVVEVSVFCV